MLRIGLLLDDGQVCQQWQYEIIEWIKSSGFTSIDLVILNGNRPENKGLGRILKKKHKVYLLHSLLDKLLFLRNEVSAFQKVELKPIEAETIIVFPDRVSYYEEVSESDISKIKNRKLDIIIRFGFGIIIGDILNAAKYGVWSFHHGDNRHWRGVPSCYWEVMKKEATVGAILQKLTNELDNGGVLGRVSMKTELHSFMLTRNNLFWRSTDLIKQTIKNVYRNQELEIEDNTLGIYDSILYKKPPASQAIMNLFIWMDRVLKKSAQKVFGKKRIWFLLLGEKDKSLEIRKFKKLIPPKNYFWADPFPVENQQDYYLFIEEFSFDKQKGHISCLHIKDGEILSNEVVLDEIYHLSYPHIVKHDNTYYMIPDKISINRIDIYQAEEFPYKWEMAGTIMDNVKACDSTIYFHEGLWWLFTTIDKSKNSTNYDQLYLYYSKDLLQGNWISHPKNPIKNNVKNSRSAGNIYQTKDGKIIRPAQNCARRYGHKIVFNQIQVLNTKDYKEEEIGIISPDWEKDIIGTHTFNISDNYIVIDALK